jgi:hypothetical protein
MVQYPTGLRSRIKPRSTLQSTLPQRLAVERSSFQQVPSKPILFA